MAGLYSSLQIQRHISYHALMKKTKICSICKKRKRIEKFGVRNRDGKVTCRSRCSPCNAAYHRAYRKKNPAAYAKQRASVDKSKAEDLAMLNRLRAETPCADCKKIHPPWRMQFDHLPEYEKVTSISTLLGSKNKLSEELKKCELVCANCHTDRTHARKQQSAAAE